ncbi:MAG: hypothetical protein DMG49_15180 [Acidobacteria bacterium]|nr:MAG: hypothetical protein DMG49_15180 [Acidobacteriota bacterium]
MTRAQRAIACAVGIIPVSAAGNCLSEIEITTAMSYLAFILVAAQVIAICAVVAVMAWTKAHGFTGVIPYFPHRRRVERLLP